MATQTLPETSVETTDKNPATKYVFSFGGGKADGNGKMKDDLGGKGAGLAEMTNAGLPVPPGFTIQTEACREYMRTNGVSAEVERQMDAALKKLEELQGQKLRQRRKPAAGERALGREVFHARHDGHHSQPRSQRSERRGPGETQQQSTLRCRFLSPPDPDVRQRRTRNPEACFR